MAETLIWQKVEPQGEEVAAASATSNFGKYHMARFDGYTGLLTFTDSEGRMRPIYNGNVSSRQMREEAQKHFEGLMQAAQAADRDLSFVEPVGNRQLDGWQPAIKDTNPKDAVGIRKWRTFTTVPMTVLAEVGVAMLEGARKYGRHNYRAAGVRASVYVDAAMGHVMQWWEGEDVDADSQLSHITKAIASLVVLRDAMIQEMLTDDRPPKGDLDATRAEMQRVVDALFERHPEAKAAFVHNPVAPD